MSWVDTALKKRTTRAAREAASGISNRSESASGESGTDLNANRISTL